MIQSYLMSMVGYCILSLPLYIILRYLVMRRKTSSIGREFLMILFFLYSVSIFSQTIIPRLYIMNGALTFDFMEKLVRSSNLVPLRTIRMYVAELQGPLASIAFYNLAGNIILFIPFGFFIPCLWKKFRSFRVMCIIGLMIPLFIEGTQYFIGRSTDIDDVILNTLSIILGYFFFVVAQRCMKIMRNE